jgi:hypothetical protein
MNQDEPEKEKVEGVEIPAEPEPSKEASTPAPTPTAIRTESRWKHFFRIALRWVIGFVIVFMLGVLAMEFAFYRPLASQLDQIKTERDQAQQSIKNLQGQIDNLTPLSTQNTALQNQLSQSQLHVTVLSAEANVYAAQVSLLNEKPADARLALNKTMTTLKTLQGMLPPDQQKVVTDMQTRLNLVLSELDTNKFAAQSDLNVLETSLVQMENILFANP